MGGFFMRFESTPQPKGTTLFLKFAYAHLRTKAFNAHQKKNLEIGSFLLCIRDFEIKYRKFDMQAGSLRFLAKFKQHLKAV